MATQPGPVMEFLGRVAYEFEMMRPLFPTYLHLLISAIFPIYTAAHASLSRPPSAAARKKTKRATSDDEDDDEDYDEEEESPQIESLTPSDALVFPLLAGGTLASLYFILKWLQDPAWLNWVLGIYFSQIGLFFAIKFLKDVFAVARSVCFPATYSWRGRIWKVDEREHRYKTDDGRITASPFPGLFGATPLPASLTRQIWRLRNLLYAKARLKFHIHGLITVKRSVDILDVVSLPLSCILVYYHGFVSKPWFLTNFLGFSFCYGSLQYMTPTTAWTGTLVLSALFFYDIYFVFFTPMMVTVATKLDVPIKLLFPRPDGCVYPIGAPEGSPAMEEYLQCLAKKRTMAMLGLGDIVVPGMLLAFALRFDLYLHYLRKGRSDQKSTDSTKIEQNEPSKPIYANAKGAWGERFWTSSKLWTKDVKAKQFPKPYFYATIFGYLAGMVTTVVVMQIAQHAQPALLYLVPGVLLSLWGTALFKGDLKLLWHYTELQGEEKKKTADDDTKKENAAPQLKSSEQMTEAASTDVVKAPEKGEHDGSVEQQDTNNDTQKSTRGRQNSHSSKLVYLSISLPKHASARAHELSATTTRKDESSDITKLKTRDIPHQRPGQEQSEDGEPPEKRARLA
ncbi:hypothetical protein ABEF91_000260 [Exophiala dermatitidis]